MKLNLITVFLLIFSILSACQAATSAPGLTANVNEEFTLAPGQAAVVADANLTITLQSVPGDNRCPSEVECVVSGPVTVSLSVQQGDETPTDVTLRTFTDNTGRAPDGSFEGITNSVEAGKYVIQVAGVTPYPKNPEIEIEPSEYRVTLLVSNQ